MAEGEIVLSGGKDLALKLEAEGYDWVGSKV
jgi:Fe-S cluster assembly ATPase SufC